MASFRAGCVLYKVLVLCILLSLLPASRITAAPVGSPSRVPVGSPLPAPHRQTPTGLNPSSTPSNISYQSPTTTVGGALLLQGTSIRDYATATNKAGFFMLRPDNLGYDHIFSPPQVTYNYDVYLDSIISIGANASGINTISFVQVTAEHGVRTHPNWWIPPADDYTIGNALGVIVYRSRLNPNTVYALYKDVTANERRGPRVHGYRIDHFFTTPTTTRIFTHYGNKDRTTSFRFTNLSYTDNSVFIHYQWNSFRDNRVDTFDIDWDAGTFQVDTKEARHTQVTWPFQPYDAHFMRPWRAAVNQNGSDALVSAPNAYLMYGWDSALTPFDTAAGIQDELYASGPRTLYRLPNEGLVGTLPAPLWTAPSDIATTYSAVHVHVNTPLNSITDRIALLLNTNGSTHAGVPFISVNGGTTWTRAPQPTVGAGNRLGGAFVLSEGTYPEDQSINPECGQSATPYNMTYICAAHQSSTHAASHERRKPGKRRW